MMLDQHPAEADAGPNPRGSLGTRSGRCGLPGGLGGGGKSAPKRAEPQKARLRKAQTFFLRPRRRDARPSESRAFRPSPTARHKQATVARVELRSRATQTTTSRGPSLDL